jgi:hypothetical protein
MDIDQIRSRMALGRSKTCIIDISESREFPGYVRTIRTIPDSSVEVEYDQFGHDEGGAYFTGDYPTLEDAVAAIEKYLGVPRSSWPQAPVYPGSLSTDDTATGHDRLAAAIASGSVPLPPGTQWSLQDGYWSRFLKI